MKKIICLGLFLYLSSLTAANLHIAAFNIQASDSNASVIAQQMASIPKINIWAIEESTNKYARTILDTLRQLPNTDFASILGQSGNNMRLQLFYDRNQITLNRSFELDEMNPQNRVRSPLVALFMENKQHIPFYIMVNHLYRSDQQARIKQANQINQWASQQSFPVIAVGDYNFDLNPEDPSQHDAGFDHLIAQDIFTWAKPSQLIPTQCSHFNSILDFIFISTPTKKWINRSEILFQQNDYCPDTNQTSDHRPITAALTITAP